MSTATTPTRIFGIPVKVDPKILIIGLAALAAFLFWYNSRSDEETGNSTPSSLRGRLEEPAAAVTKAHTRVRTSSTNSNERGALRIRPVIATNGDVDPTLRLDLLERLAKVEPANGVRNLFEIGPATMAGGPGSQIKGPVVLPTPIRPVSVGPGGQQPGQLNIPLKYYGFVKPAERGATNQGFFLDGDNILIASEGDVLKTHYMVVTLTPNSARLEDTQARQAQTLPVVPEAVAQ